MTATEVLNESPAAQTGLTCHTDYQHICMPAGSLWDQTYLRPTLWVLRPAVMTTWMRPNYFGTPLQSKRLAIILSPAKKTKMIFATLRGFNCLPLFIIPRVSVRPQRLLGTFLLSSLQFGAQYCSELPLVIFHSKEEIRKAAMYGANEVPSLVAFNMGVLVPRTLMPWTQRK